MSIRSFVADMIAAPVCALAAAAFRGNGVEPAAMANPGAALEAAVAGRRRAESAARALADVGRSLSMSLDPDVIAQSAVDSICRLLSVPVAILLQREAEGGRVTSVAISIEGAAAYGRPLSVAWGEGAVSLAMRERRPVMSLDVLDDARLTLPAELRRQIERTGYRSVLALPVGIGEHAPSGGFLLSDRTGRPFSPDEVFLAEAFASQAAVAFDNARMHAETAQRLRDTELLLSVSQAIGSTLDVAEVFRRAARAMVRALDADLGGAWVITADGAGLSPLVGYHLPKEVVAANLAASPAPPLAEEVMQLRAALHVEHSSADPRLDHVFFQLIDHRSVLFVPVRSSAGPVGAFAVIWVRKTQGVAAGQQRLVEAIAGQAAVAIDNARLLEAERDSRQRLAASERRYQQLFENVNDIVYLHDLSGRLLEVNEAAVRASGYAREELIGLNVSALMPEDDFARAMRQIGRAARDGLPSGFFATELISKDGDRLDLEINATLVVEDGRTVAVEGVGRDVTARRRSETRHATFVEVVRELAAEDDFETLISLISRSICRLLGTDSAGFVVVEGDELVFRRPVEPSGERRQKVAESRLARVVTTQRPALSESMETDPHWRDSRAVRDAGFRAVVEVPVILRGEVVGVLSALHRTPRSFSSEDVTLLAALADHTALAFDRTRLVTDLNARLAEMRGLLTVSQAISSTLDLTETMRRVARAAGRTFGADMVGAYLADAGDEALVPVAGYHVPRHLLEAFRDFTIPLKGHALLESAWRDHQPVWSDDLEADPRIDRAAWSRFPHRSGMFVPMVVSDRPIGGLLLVWWHQRRIVRPSEVQLADGIARQAAIAVANSRSFDDAQRRRREAEELAGITHRLTASLDAATVARMIVDQVLVLLKADSAVLRLCQPDGRLVQIARAGRMHPGFDSGTTLPPGAGFVGRAVRTGKPVQTTDLLMEPESVEVPSFREALAATGLHAAISVPLHVKGRIIGTLSMAFTAIRHCSDAEVTLLQAFADPAALALDNARLYQGEQEARTGLRRLSSRLMEIQEAERRRLALELHDEIGQSLTALKLSLELARASATVPEVRARLRDSLQLSDRVLQQIRSLSLDLRPSLLDDLGLSAALRSYVPRQAERAGITAEVVTDLGEHRLPAHVETTCFRIVQEAVTNILRHARAGQISVGVHAHADRVELRVEDDGVGFDVAVVRRDVRGGRSLGLLGMEERVSLIDGRLSIDSAPGRGTRIHVVCPLAPATSAPGAPPTAEGSGAPS